MATEGVFLTVDLGAGSLRTAAIDPHGVVRALDAQPLGSTEPQPGWAEVDPEVWWRATAAGLGRVLAALPSAVPPLALCVTGMTRTQVLLDAEGRSLRPAILWRDRRAVEDAAAVAAHVSSPNPATAVTPFHPLARLAWIARVEPQVFDCLAVVLEPKDFLNARLTGMRAADGVTAARLDDLGSVSDAAPDRLRRCLALLDLPRPMPWTRVGEVSAPGEPFERLRGLPVFAGAMDTWAGAIGSGVCVPGRAYDIAGTSEAVGLVTAAAARVPGLVTLPWSEDAWQAGGATQAGGDAARWAYETCRIVDDFDAALERAGGLSPAQDLPTFLPYLAGERTPVWRSDVRGAFCGLARDHGPDAMLWSVLEGVASAVRDILDTAAGGTGAAVDEVRVSGGGARSDAWCRLKANVLGVPVVRTREIETGLVGCAVAAAVGLGLHPSLAAAANAMAPVARAFEPDRSLSGLFAARFARYQSLKGFALGAGAQFEYGADRSPAVPAADLPRLS